jgi:large subunit ribosomal protein L4e
MVNIYSLEGKVKGKVDLPAVFKTPYRPDLIQKTVVAEQANARQAYGVTPLSGLKTSADYFGSRRKSYRQTINRAQSRLPRVKTGGGGLGRVRRVPQAVGGRRAHPPRARDLSRKVNRKEYQLALHSAVAATAVKHLVEGRGHVVGDRELPIVVEDGVEDLQKARDVVKALESLGLGGELGSRRKKRILIVVNEDKGIRRAAAGIKGVEVATLNELDVDLLAPGTHAGRLTVWGESAVKKVS